MEVKIITVGTSKGILLPDEVLSQLNVKEGSSLYLTFTSSGIKLSPYESEFKEQIEMAKEIMKQNKDVLAELAK